MNWIRTPRRLTLALFVLAFSTGAAAEDVTWLVREGKPVGVHLDAGEWYPRGRFVEGRGVENYLYAKATPAGANFRVVARVRILEQRGSAASFFLGPGHFGFEGARETLYVNGGIFGGLSLLGSPTEYFPRGEWFDFEVVGKEGEIEFRLNGKLAHRVTYDGSGFERVGFSPWRSQMQIEKFVLYGGTRPYALPASRGYSVPTLDLSSDRHRQIVVDREAGQYLGHPTTVLLEDGRTLLCVYPKGHGRGGIVYKRSRDGGRTWSERLPTPASWATSKEVPTIHRVVDAAGKKRLILWSGLYPARLAVSEDDGASWSELVPAGDWGGIVVMGFVEKLKTPGRYLAMFHDDGRFLGAQPNRRNPARFQLLKTFSGDGGLTWSSPEVVYEDSNVHLCEPGCIRSPDGKRLAVLLRENSRQRNSFVIFSDDEGATWTAPRELPGSLTGDRHTGKYLPDGRLFVSFRDRTHDSPTKGDWVAWVGTFEDIVAGKEGQYRVRLMRNTKDADCAYPGVEVLPDGTIVATTYGHWTKGEPPYVVSVRLKVEELDALAAKLEPELEPAGTTRKNVLFIVVDDLRPELGCYGSTIVKSPNIDRLAREGVLFDRAYCQFALCNPSRTSVLTGMRPDRVGVVGNHSHFRDRHPSLVTLPEHFKRHGYETRAVGKIYHGVFPTGSSVQPADTMGDLASWSARPYRPGPRYYYTKEGVAAAKRAYARMYRVEDPAPHDWTSRLVFGPMTEAPDVPDEDLYDGDVARRAVELLRELRDRRFFLAVGFIKPHTPFVAPKRYWDRYDPREIALAARSTLPADAASFAGHSSGEVRRYTDQPKRGPFSAENQRRMRHGYAACVSFVDAQVGRLLDELDRLRLRESTAIVLFGDHGWHLGEHGLWGKVTNFELATRSPLIVSAPGLPRGEKTRSLTELLDIYPSICELAGLPNPRHLDGRSFVPVLRKSESNVKTAAFSQMSRGGVMGYSVRVDGARYTEWIDSSSGAVRARELYHYEGGPVESRNLAEQPQSRDQVERLSARLRESRRLPNAGRLSLARVFQDHMVLQRDSPIRVWGRAPPRERVHVQLGELSRSSVANDRGDWRVQFPALAASDTPRRLVARTNSDAVVIRDVLVGEVWLCAGQSNMEWPLSQSNSGPASLSQPLSPRIRLVDLRGAARGGSGVYSPETIAQLKPKAFARGAWRVSSPPAARGFSAVGFYFGRAIERELDVPVGLIDVSIGGTPIESWIRRSAIAADPELRALVDGDWLENELLDVWCRNRARQNLGRAMTAGEEIPGDALGPNHSFKPGFMWSASVEPLVPFNVRGVLWYQGESNAESVAQVARYGRLFELLVGDWRARWDRKDLPFAFVQLPALRRPHWPLFREEQRRVLDRVPGTGMVVTMDIGAPSNVHPTLKKPVGDRLARWALATVYGRVNADANGPLITSARRSGRRVILRFHQATSGLDTADARPPRHFELAGEDGEFRAAAARIDGDAVIVTADDVAIPKTVRYAWTPYPEPPVNFVNGDRLPASPFSVDVED